MRKVTIILTTFLLTILLSSCEQKVAKEIEDMVLRGIPNNIEVLDTLFQSNEYVSESDKTVNMPYRLYAPNTDTLEKYPLVIFLHGKAERGNDNYKHIVKNTPFDSLILDEEISNQYKCAALAPHLPEDYEWTDETVINTLIELVRIVSDDENIDKEKIYVIGISMGGTGMFKLLSENAEIFAGGISICGGEKKNFITNKIKETPIWSFHAIDDPFEKVNTARKIVKTIEDFDGNIKYTEYETGGHMIWGKVYNDPQVFEWLFEQRKE